MSTVLNEHTQYIDPSTSAPLVNGNLYIGTDGLNAKTNTITIYSDRALTVSIANPQLLDSSGRTTNKIYIPGRYSILAENSAAVQKYANLNNGEVAASGVTSLSNVSGTNTITAEATSTITTYTNLEIYTFIVANANTGAVTLNIDAVSADAIVKNFDKPIVAGDFQPGQIVNAQRHNANSNFQWVGKNNEVVEFYEGSAVVAAATTNIWATDGNTLHVTGSTGITSFGTAPNVGARRRVIFDGAPLLTDGANLNLPGAVNYQCEAGDIADVYADTTTLFQVTVIPVDGLTAVGAFATQSDQETATSLIAYVNSGGQHLHPSAAKGWVKFNSGGVIAASYNVTSVTDTGSGDWTVNWATDFSSADYCVSITASDFVATSLIGYVYTGTQQAGSVQALATSATATGDTSGVLNDAGSVFVVAYGDQ